ncbi:HAD family hydrolase [Deinococcus soli (ex Cha et al. 2016)]|uniref:TFIIF-interacting CTD phosphatase-like protein n=2 Tax=Deinococcus soli (ex Cha et al. 2016) TaxID=1309411 RepID=A0AAE3XDM5_9DEIO|nr:HAD family hydrolase [Deinococcus soli (ex Cha et al. 2016)]MDR6218933.1 TFIIF-interacting CTD phosphatase-like protein [Deinococcus soli (ex Cha et al. 2016)]MDR6328730.1 TFIIF-interacting CTD phosphatase-like protein [Deinococcus soli (ex Cha et al. 2016)]MDR6751783.1 TFIIF-interacting CTD phosphatase-like protein [Deinococcus soli (ex Cha et al. 2016)]
MERTRPLLVLDLDETLWTSYDVPVMYGAERHFVLRPGLQDFLEQVGAQYTLAAWTAASRDHAQAGLDAMAHAGIPFTPEFLWDRDRCTYLRLDDGDVVYAKRLRKLRSRYPLERVLAVDDRPENFRCAYGNFVRVLPFTGSPDDRELPRLAAYLLAICGVPNFRRLEKRTWRDHPAAQAA